MPSKLSMFVARICESSWLAALVIVPILFNPYTERFFEEDKIPLMRSTALIVLAGLLVAAGEQWSLRETHKRAWWKVPLVVPVLLLTGAYLLATLFAVDPQVSWWGAYLRSQGTYTLLSYIIIFFAVLCFVREEKQIQHIITIILLTSVPVALYAFLQNNGLDPIQWRDSVERRVMSTLGNPIFIGAYLIMVVPLTIMRIIEHFQQLLQSDEEQEEKEEKDSPNYFASSLLLGAYLFLLIIQLMSIIYSQSRGPLLALLIGLACFALFTSILVGRWLTLTFIGLGVLGITFLVVFNLPNTPLEPLKQLPYLERLGSLDSGQQGGIGSGRPQIWQGGIDLLRDNPLRDIVGYGPDAMYIVYEPYSPPELAELSEFKGRMFDRSHNEVLDLLIMTGVFGLSAFLLVCVTLFYYFFKWLNFIKTKSQGYGFIGLVVMGSLIAILLSYLIDGSFRFFGIALPLGIIAGMMIYLLILALTRFEQVSQPRPHALLLITLFSIIITHFIELQFGIAISATRLYFWVYAALIVVIGSPLLRSATKEQSTNKLSQKSTSRRTRSTKKRNKNKTQQNMPSETWWNKWQRTLPSLSSTILLSLMMSLMLMVMTFNFYIHSFEIEMNPYPIVWLFLATWLYGALIVAAESSFEKENKGGWLLRLSTYALISLGIWGMFCLIYIPWVQPPVMTEISLETFYALVNRMANAITVLYLFVFLIIILAAIASFFITRKNKNPDQVTPPMMRGPVWLAGVYAALFLLVVPLTVNTNLNVSRADTFNKEGIKYENGGQLEPAILLYEKAVEMQGHQEYYVENLHRATLNQAQIIEDSAEQSSSDLLEQP